MGVRDDEDTKVEDTFHFCFDDGWWDFPEGENLLLKHRAD